jgi:hypothetical protein
LTSTRSNFLLFCIAIVVALGIVIARVLKNTGTVDFARTHTAPDSLTRNGRDYSLLDGRVFVIDDDAHIVRVPIRVIPCATERTVAELVDT